MAEAFEPELGQLAFGCASGAVDFDSLPDSQKMENMLRVLADRATGDECYANHFENGVFEMHPYYWGDCTCGYEQKEWDWGDSHDHTPECYQTEYRATVGKYRVLDPGRDKAARKLCLKHGIPWNNGAGSAVHCTCTYDSEWQKFTGENGHAAVCPIVVPNFRHKVSGFELRWYKHIGRGMSVNRPVTLEEFRIIFDECMASLVKAQQPD